MTNPTEKSYQSIIDDLLRDIYLLKEEATVNYEQTGKMLYFGQVDACETIRSMIHARLDDVRQTASMKESRLISLVDAIEPTDRLTTRLDQNDRAYVFEIQKTDRLTESMKSTYGGGVVALA